ncbi:MAG TPA: PAS domain-containing sensor histidine kinase [Patescibacteria group bacterium]|nr:PAS domain-containing sensor histidine kinase [Patescibacteria group bacterium]
MEIMIIIGGLVAAVLAFIFLLPKIRKSSLWPSTNPAAHSSSLAHSLEIERSKSDIILSSVDDGVVVIDDRNIIQLFNPAAARISGWVQNEALSLDYRNVIKLVDNKNQPYSDALNPFTQVFHTGKTARDNQGYLLGRGGKRIAISVSVSPLYDQKKRLSGVVGILSDVSQSRNEEAQRAEFISTASHEMRTPVAAIEGYLALAMNDKVSQIDAKARGYLEKAHTSTEHLGQLFQDLLTSAKAEDGRLSNHPGVIELSGFFEQRSEDLRFAAENKGLRMEYVVGTDNDSQAIVNAGNVKKVVQPLYYVYADPDRLREVITNLFDNAVKYTESGKVTIGLTGNENIVQFYVKDTGAGIPAEDVPHLFQKFYRVNNTLTRTVGGTGLGLFLSQKIVELYGGRIWLESSMGKGTTVFVNMPRLSSQRASELQSAEGSQLARETPTPIISA